jgi:hypothetical protein
MHGTMSLVNERTQSVATLESERTVEQRVDGEILLCETTRH